MKKVHGFVMFLLLFGAAAESKSLYLVRHGEKANDGTKDPVLTVEGQQRAQNLAHILSHAGISKVYATDYQRTQLTAKPLADLLGIEVTSYNPSQLPAFAEELKAQQDNVLVVGHSNTTPELAHLLSAKPMVKMGEEDFEFILQVVIEGEHRTLNVLKSLPNHVKKATAVTKTTHKN